MKSRLITPFLIAVYAAVLVSTNHLFTFLDDESVTVVVAGHPVGPTLKHYFAGTGMQAEHPPLSDILFHIWLLTTHYSFFGLRIFANILFVAGIFLVAKSAGRIGGEPAYWSALLLGFLWPFAFQYGRITGWYSVSMFFLSWVTWTYLQILEDRGYRPWVVFAIASVLLVWSNYFGFVFLLVLLADLLLFHRPLAAARVTPLLATLAFITAAFLPLLRIALQDLALYTVPIASRWDWKNELAVVGYPSFAIFGSAAIAPWYWPLSAPVFLAVVAVFAATWSSSARRWMVYFLLSALVLDLSGQFSVKRMLFLLPWLFLAISVAAVGPNYRCRIIASCAVVTIVACGWIGIISGRHYATTNLYEPWSNVAKAVAQDARDGAAIVSENQPFLLYLDYQLGLQSETQSADGPFLEQAYRTHGYKILDPEDWGTWAPALHGKVVIVDGSGGMSAVQAEKAVNETLRRRCAVLGEYHAAPDPAAAWKARFAKGVPIFAYRTNVIWYDCGQ